MLQSIFGPQLNARQASDVESLLDELLTRGSLAAWAPVCGRAARWSPAAGADATVHNQLLTLLPRYLASACELEENADWVAVGSALETSLVPLPVAAVHVALAGELCACAAVGGSIVSTLAGVLASAGASDAETRRRLLAPLLWELTGRLSGMLPPIAGGPAASAPCLQCDGLLLDVEACGDSEGMEGPRTLSGAGASIGFAHHIGTPLLRVVQEEAVMSAREVLGGDGAATAAAASASRAAATAIAAPPPLRPVASLLDQASFVQPLRALTALLQAPGVLMAVLSEPVYGWGAPLLPASLEALLAAPPVASAAAADVSLMAAAAAAPAGTSEFVPPCSGVDLQTRSLLGRVLSLGPRYRDFLDGSDAPATRLAGAGCVCKRVDQPGGVLACLLSEFLRITLPGEAPAKAASPERAAAGLAMGGSGASGASAAAVQSVVADPLGPLIARDGSAARAGVPRLLARALRLAGDPLAAGLTDPASVIDRLRARLAELRVGMRVYEAQVDALLKAVAGYAEPLPPSMAAAFPATPATPGRGAVPAAMATPAAASSANATSTPGSTPLHPATPAGSGSGAVVGVTPASISGGRLLRGREALFSWAGLLADTAASRSKLAYTDLYGAPPMQVLPHTALLVNSARALVRLCGGFLDPASRRAADIDLRYLCAFARNGAGGGRFHARHEQCLASTGGDDGDSGGGGGARWLDVRNLARQQQFRERQAALLRAAAAAAEAAAAAGAGALNNLDAASAAPARALMPEAAGPFVWNAVTEFFGLAVRLSHLAATPSYKRAAKLLERAHKLRTELLDGADALLAMPGDGLVIGSGGSGSFAPNVFPQLQHLLRSRWALGKCVESWVGTFAFAGDMDSLLGSSVPLARATAVALSRAIVADSEGWVAAQLAGAGGAAVSAGSTPRRLVSGSGQGAGAGLSDAATSSATPRLLAGAFTGASPPQAAAIVRALAAGAATGLPDVLPPMPLPPPCASLRTLPEYLLADAAELLHWLTGAILHAVHPVNPMAGNPSVYFEDAEPAMRDIATALLLFLSSQLHLHNPYLRGALVRALLAYVPPRDHPARYVEDTSFAAGRVPPKARGRSHACAPMQNILARHPLAMASLGPALVVFHVDIASGGAHNAFYMKFEERVQTSELLDYLWGFSAHRAALLAWMHEGEPSAGAAGASADAAGGGGEASSSEAAATSNYSWAVRFASAVVDDLLFHMDEALKALRDVRAVERLRGDAVAWAALSDTERGEKEASLKQTLGLARSCLYYAAGQTSLVSRLADGGGRESAAFIFLAPDVRGKLACNLGYLLDHLAHPAKRGAFAVADPAAIGFSPRAVLLELMTALTSVAAAAEGAGSGAAEAFAAAIAADERSYNDEAWAQAEAIMGAATARGDFVEANPHVGDVLARWRRLRAAAAAAARARVTEEAELGDLPDDVIDPLLSTLMLQPVCLPTSGEIADRPSIARHLLDEERDPFSRAHLTTDMLLPLPDLARAIAEWRSARVSKRVADEAAALARVSELREKIKSDWVAARAAERAAAVAAVATPSLTPSTSLASATAPATSAPPQVSDSDIAAASSDGDDSNGVELRRALSLSLAAAADDDDGAGANAIAISGEDDDELAAALQMSLEPPP